MAKGLAFCSRYGRIERHTNEGKPSSTLKEVMGMNDKKLLSKKSLADRPGADPELLVTAGMDAPTRWSYNKERMELCMMFRDGEKTVISTAKAILGDDCGLYQIATLENSRQIVLWHANKFRRLT